ncbi:MAG: hypothetical protein ACLUNO_11085 [Oscillospiraceae bacterium]
MTYVQPACEKVTKPELKLLDGVWYGRDADKTTVVKITVADGEITETAVVSGESSGAAYDAAACKAEYKATYGDISTYDAADPQSSPAAAARRPTLTASRPRRSCVIWLSPSMRTSTGAALTSSRRSDIALSGEWLPIGWALNGEVNGKRRPLPPTRSAAIMTAAIIRSPACASAARTRPPTRWPPASSA